MAGFFTLPFLIIILYIVTLSVFELGFFLFQSPLVVSIDILYIVIRTEPRSRFFFQKA